MAVEREGEGQENEGGRDGKGRERLKKAKKTEGNNRGNLPKLSTNKKGASFITTPSHTSKPRLSEAEAL